MRSNGNGHTTNYHRLAIGLGWFSLGLGIAQLIAPRGLCRAIGVRADPNLVRLLGAREIASGINILAQRRQPAAAVQGRVLGDAVDLALLGGAMTVAATSRSRLAVATAAVAGVTALDALCGAKLHGKPPVSNAIRIRKTLTINSTPETLYQHWRNFSDLPRLMSHLEAVEVTGPRTSHWVAKGPAGTQVEWDAEILEDRPGELISWYSLENADVRNSGVVRFEKAPGNRGTMVRVELEFVPPAGKLGRTVAKLFGEDPEKQINVDLQRFKQFIETGEVARTEGQPAARSRSTSRIYDDFVRT